MLNETALRNEIEKRREEGVFNYHTFPLTVNIYYYTI